MGLCGEESESAHVRSETPERCIGIGASGSGAPERGE